MERIVYIYGNGLKVFEWKGNTLLATFSFSRTDTDLDDLNFYLSACSKDPVRIVVDLVEEEFRTEYIPKLNSQERRGVIDRLLDRHLRDVEHKTVISNGFVKNTRKEEELLIGSISNFDEVAPWLDVLTTNGIPVVGIWSAPLLQAKLLDLIDGPKENVLFVSRDVPWTQRETFIKSGKVCFSRLEKLDIDLTTSSNPGESVSLLQKGTEQIRHYLTNHRIVGFTDSISVYCFIDEAEIQPSNKLLTKSTADGLSYNLINLSTVLKVSKVENADMSSVDVLVAWACKNQRSFRDHYTLSSERFGYHQYLFTKSVSFLGFCASLVFVTIASLLMLDVFNYSQQRHVATNELNTLLSIYDENYSANEREIELATPIKNSIHVVNGYEQKSKQTPQAYFSDLSKIYSNPKYHNIRLDSLSWVTHSGEELNEFIVGELKNNSLVSANYEFTMDDEPEIESDQYTSSKEIPVIKLKGFLDRGDLSHRSVVAQMTSFTDDLSQLPVVKRLHIIKMPVDVRLDATYNDRAGNLVLESDSKDKGYYELLLLVDSDVI